MKQRGPQFLGIEKLKRRRPFFPRTSRQSHPDAQLRHAPCFLFRSPLRLNSTHPTSVPWMRRHNRPHHEWKADAELVSSNSLAEEESMVSPFIPIGLDVRAGCFLRPACVPREPCYSFEEAQGLGLLAVKVASGKSTLIENPSGKRPRRSITPRKQKIGCLKSILPWTQSKRLVRAIYFFY